MQVTSQGSAQARFQRAVRNGHVGHADIAAHELGQLALADALGYTVLLVRARDPRALRAAHRWVRRVRHEHALSNDEAEQLLSALLAINGRFADAAVGTLQTACRRLGLPQPVLPGYVRASA
jgi:hypothetical protein